MPLGIHKLPTESKHIKFSNSFEHMQNLMHVANRGNAGHILAHIAAIINKETNEIAAAFIDQALLNFSFRCYYQLLYAHQFKDEYFKCLTDDLPHQSESDFLKLYAALQTEHSKHVIGANLTAKCVSSLLAAIRTNASSILIITKTLNLLIKKQPRVVRIDLNLADYYHCLLTAGQSGLRDEILRLFNHSCKDKCQATGYFEILVQHWPWTNRNKYYLLSGILNSHNLKDFTKNTGINLVDFFCGLRLSLNYKNLLAASQYLVRSLSNQKEPGIYHMATDILSYGTLAELKNFNAYWFSNIKPHEEIFKILKTRTVFRNLCIETETPEDQITQYRYIYIISMFARQYSSEQFVKFSTQLLKTYATFELDVQLLIFLFVVDNLNGLNIEDSLKFVFDFITYHNAVESAHFRNTLLARMPIIINHIAKNFNKVPKDIHLDETIVKFFGALQQLVQENIQSGVYQPKIFALRLLEILYNSLHAENILKNTKTCNIAQNTKLGSFLRDQGIFKATDVTNQLLTSLKDPHGYDDAQNIIIYLLKQINCFNSKSLVKLCLNYCKRVDLDECALAKFYAQLVLRIMTLSEKEKFEQMITWCWHYNMLTYDLFPVENIKCGSHIFAYLNVLNEVMLTKTELSFDDAISLSMDLYFLQYKLLKMLGATWTNCIPEIIAPSFERMDNTLRATVDRCKLVSHVDQLNYQKILLNSICLSLKAVCELTTTCCYLLVKRVVKDPKYNMGILENLLNNIAMILLGCRHKGVIESAGLCLGKCVRRITEALPIHCYTILFKYIEKQLLINDKQVASTTRRGSGYSIMFLYIIKNDEPRERPLLKFAMWLILSNWKNASARNGSENAEEHIYLDTLILHYLCTLVKDAELRSAMSKYYNDIFDLAMNQIDNAEWSVCNAALQLFGALVPKLDRQQQPTEYDVQPAWEPTELNYNLLECILPKACQLIFEYYNDGIQHKSTRAMVLFLVLMSKVENLRQQKDEDKSANLLLKYFRVLCWQLLEHKCMKVRELAAKCFARVHQFSTELPQVIIAMAKILPNQHKENFYQGLLFALRECLIKLQQESKYIWQQEKLADFMRKLCLVIQLDKLMSHRHTYYSFCALLEILQLIYPYTENEKINELVSIKTYKTKNVFCGRKLDRDKC